MKTLQIEVLKRFMSEEELQTLQTNYKNSLKSIGAAPRLVGETDRKILQDYKDGKTIKQLSTFYSMGEHAILKAIALALK